MPRVARRLVILCCCMAVVAATGGCVQRRMTIRSSPPGAAVYVDDYQIGTAPVSHDFVYYGTRKIRLVKDGYETLTVRQPIPAPWYEYFPLDFVSENLIPWEIRDERVIDLALAPAAAIPADEVVSRAEQVRLAAGQQPVVPVPAGAVPVPAGMPMQPVSPPVAQPLPMPAGPGPFLAPPAGMTLPPPQPNQPTQGIPSLGMP
jgi:hypothetical protein